MSTFDCEIDLDYQGNPRIKVTKDAPTVTLSVHTQDVNALMALVDTPLELKVKDGTNRP